MIDYDPNRVLVVSENKIDIGRYPSVEVIKSATIIRGCSLVAYYNKQQKIGILIHFADNPNEKNLDEWILSMLEEGKKMMQRECVENLIAIDVKIMARTLRERYSKRQNEILEKLCSFISTPLIGIDGYDNAGIYLKNGGTFVE